MPPFFSIITVTYNAERVLEWTLRSVCDQSYRNIEYILVDGASTDGTIGLVAPYRDRLTAQNKRFELVSEPDKGLYDAMNKGLRMATGDYVWFLNAGDLFLIPSKEDYFPNTIMEALACGIPYAGFDSGRNFCNGR